MIGEVASARVTESSLINEPSFWEGEALAERLLGPAWSMSLHFGRAKLPLSLGFWISWEGEAPAEPRIGFGSAGASPSPRVALRLGGSLALPTSSAGEAGLNKLNRKELLRAGLPSRWICQEINIPIR